MTIAAIEASFSIWKSWRGEDNWQPAGIDRFATVGRAIAEVSKIRPSLPGRDLCIRQGKDTVYTENADPGPARKPTGPMTGQQRRK